MDWSSVNVGIYGEQLAKTGLRKYRQELEAEVKPYLVNNKSTDVILYRGKRRHFVPPGKKSPAFRSMLALQHLYKLQRAWKKKDIDAVVRQSFGLCDALHERMNIQYFKSESLDALAAQMRYQQRAISAGKTRSALNAEQQQEVRSDIATLIRTGQAESQRDACESLAEKYGVGWRTLKRYDDSPL
jgi:hypothetical protein